MTTNLTSLDTLLRDGSRYWVYPLLPRHEEEFQQMLAELRDKGWCFFRHEERPKLGLLVDGLKEFFAQSEHSKLACSAPRLYGYSHTVHKEALRFLTGLRLRSMAPWIPPKLSEDKPHQCHRRLVAEYLRGRWGDVEIAHL